MGKDCLAGWTELQSYRAAKANRWLWAAGGYFKRFHVFWDWRGSTGEAGACFWVGLGDQNNDSPEEARLFFPITSPRKTTGAFYFQDRTHAEQLMSIAKRYSSVLESYMTDWISAANEAIERYERVAAPLGSTAWIRQ